MIKRKMNAGLQQVKAVKGLSKAGAAGLLITETDGQTIVSFFGNKERAMIATHTAIAKTDWLKIVAEAVIGPRVTMKGTVGAADDGVNYEEGKGLIEQMATVEPLEYDPAEYPQIQELLDLMPKEAIQDNQHTAGTGIKLPNE